MHLFSRISSTIIIFWLCFLNGLLIWVQNRPSTKVKSAPGGASSLGYLFGGVGDWILWSSRMHKPCTVYLMPFAIMKISVSIQKKVCFVLVQCNVLPWCNSCGRTYVVLDFVIKTSPLFSIWSVYHICQLKIFFYIQSFFSQWQLTIMQKRH